MESERARGEVFNLGNPDERTVLEIAELIRLMTGSKSGLVFTAPAVGDDPRVRRPNIDKAKAWLGWQPRTSLEEGLRLVIRAARAELRNGANGTAAGANGAHRTHNGHAGHPPSGKSHGESAPGPSDTHA